jgi:hypothetical protein
MGHSDRSAWEHVFAMGLAAPFLAGFVAGEGHFWISENNAGQSWACGFQLAQRDDNAALVASARRQAGCGDVRWCPPNGTSHPQVLWVLQSRHACFALARLLSRFPLLGKKAGDFAIWRAAVTAWNLSAHGARRWERLQRLASELRAHRNPAVHPDYTEVDISTSDLAGFLAGFTSAEAHFGASSSGHPRFVIKLREDYTALLSLLGDRFGVGRLVPVPPSVQGHAQTAWLVTKLDELRKLVPVFDRHPPLGRAARVYRHWRELVVAAERSATALRREATRLQEARRYRSPSALRVTAPSRASKRTLYVRVLQAWARDTGLPHTTTSYECWRSRSAAGRPSRNTLARFFGSWRDALAAAGLPADGSRSRQANIRAAETAEPARALSRLHQRAAVLREVHNCWSTICRVPTASEFFRWRLENAPDSPSQAAVYRLFPGGWGAVLDALPPREIRD